MEVKRIQAIGFYTRNCLNQTKEKLNVSDDIAFLLLDHFRWKQEELFSKWESSKENLLKSLYINLGSKLVPTLESQLSFEEKSGLDRCQVCSRTKKLVEMYCGHELCKDCLIKNIKDSLKKNEIPKCHECNAEIMSHDIEKLLPPSLTTKNYKFWRINKSFQNVDFIVAICPNPLCKHLIIHENNLPCDIVKCPKCDFAICLKCFSCAHSPLTNCQNCIEFSETIKKKLTALEQEQEKWYKREERNIEYRFQNIKEVNQAFDVNLRMMIKNQIEEQQEIVQEIKNIDLFIMDINYQITKKEETLAQYAKKRRSAERIESIQKKIDNLRQDIDEYNNYKAQLLEDNEARKVIRKEELEFAQNQKKLFVDAINNREKYDVYMKQFKDNMDKYADEKARTILNDDDYIRQNTVKCPSCKFRFYKTCGCCEATCPCGYEFCTVCNEPWITHKKGFYKCQNDIPVKKVDYEDTNDGRYYPMPLDMDKKLYYAKWKRFHNLYLQQKAEYDRIYKLFLLPQEVPKPKKGAKPQILGKHPRDKLVDQLAALGVDDPLQYALRLVSNVLFTQSIIYWGFASLFYLNITEFTNEYIERLEDLEKKVKDFVDLLQNPEERQKEDFEQHLINLKEDTTLILQIKL